MDDLNGLDWSKSGTLSKPPPGNYSSSFTANALKPTPPTSGRVTPLNGPSQPSSKPATPANDSFSNLVSFSNNNSNAKLSLAEQQKKLADSKSGQQQSQARALQQQYAGGDDVWNTLGSGRSTPAVVSVQRNGSQPPQAAEEEDDLFAAFNQPEAQPKAQPKPLKRTAQPKSTEEDDDPFGLSEMKAQRAQKRETQPGGFDDDDVLGLLGEPVSKRQLREDAKIPESSPANTHHQDKAVAEIVDMGFPADKALKALESTESGMDVQGAVGWLLNQAHSEAKERSQGRDGSREGHQSNSDVRNRGDGRTQAHSRPSAFEDDAPGPRYQRQQNESREKDPAKVAADLGSQFFKTANSLWKQGSKKVQQAMQEFNSDSESGQSEQPKWMQVERKPDPRQQQRGDEAGTARRRRRSSQGKAQEQNVTDEALMLEAERPTPPPRQQPRTQRDTRFDSSADNSRDHSPAVPSRLRESSSPQPAFLRQPQARPPPSQLPSRAALTRQANEEAASQVYVSSARRRKPALPAAQASEPNLLAGTSDAPPSRPTFSRPAQSVPPKPKTAPIPVRVAAPARQIPVVSAISLKASHSHREKGNEHFKRGDYSSAHQAYSTSITHLPAGHPILLVLLTNHALTALKTGEPKTAITDCDKAISIIGVSRGEAETVDFGNGEIAKPMRDYYGKALMRKAEALEQMEKWSEAAAVWKDAVEGGHGGATSMQGRLRAEKAANPTVVKPKPAVAKKPTATSRPASRPVGQDSAAVSRLKAANQAAERADDEKFALSDTVDAKIKNWRDGKQDNLRALLGSLDTVLWPEAEWKRISMADLVLPNKVKIQYMKGISKVHPDKIPTTATTEQRMISASVFSTLNEAWDKFKTENNL